MEKGIEEEAAIEWLRLAGADAGFLRRAAFAGLRRAARAWGVTGADFTSPNLETIALDLEALVPDLGPGEARWSVDGV